jgi:hypothetical protein
MQCYVPVAGHASLINLQKSRIIVERLKFIKIKSSLFSSSNIFVRNSKSLQLFLNKKFQKPDSSYAIKINTMEVDKKSIHQRGKNGYKIGPYSLNQHKGFGI